MKRLLAMMLGVALLTMVMAPQAEARHGGSAFVLGALTGAIVAGAVAGAYYPHSYYAYSHPVVIQQPVYQPYPVYPPAYIGPGYYPGLNYGAYWGWYYR